MIKKQLNFKINFYLIKAQSMIKACTSSNNLNDAEMLSQKVF